jgi:hypothetical protein
VSRHFCCCHILLLLQLLVHSTTSAYFTTRSSWFDVWYLEIILGVFMIFQIIVHIFIFIVVVIIILHACRLLQRQLVDWLVVPPNSNSIISTFIVLLWWKDSRLIFVQYQVTGMTRHDFTRQYCLSIILSSTRFWGCQVSKVVVVDCPWRWAMGSYRTTRGSFVIRHAPLS